MTRLPLLSALTAATLLTGFATAASAADYDGDYRRSTGNNTRYEQPAVQYGQKRVPNDYDEDNYRPRHHDHGWQRPGYIRSVEARASYASDYLPFHVQEWRARREAIDNWKAKVASRYGQQFAHWRMAQDKNVDCNARRGSVDCTVSARPVPGGHGGWGGRWGWNTNY